MSTETQELQQPTSTPGADWFLQSLANVAANGVEFDLTLLVGGFLVSGMLVGERKYFESFATDFSSTFPREAAEEVKKTMMAPADIIKKAEEESSDSRPLSEFIHLREARFFNTSGNPIPGNRGILWRGRVSEVSGFMLGTLSAV
jgi:hypothetical protein